MSRIRILDPQVAAKIAAGEVITRPAAAVKELVENALDAGARTITVAVEEGGRRLIRVVDDGSGMTPEEMPLSLRRHATSKLAAEADLLSITTLGFRGEALPSIAAVSRLTLTSCPPGATGGFRVVAQAGEILSASPWAAAPGTQVEVAELFFNTPARQKFLKSEDAEQAQILESLRHLALGYPQVHFTLSTPARTLLTAPAAPSLLERVAAVFTPELAAHMLPLAFSQGAWQVTGLTTDAGFHPGQRPLPGLPGERPGGGRPYPGGGPQGGLCRASAPGPAPRGGGEPERAPRGRGRQRPSRQDRNSLSRAGQGLPAPPDGPAPGPGAAVRGEPPVPGDLAAGGPPRAAESPAPELFPRGAPAPGAAVPPAASFPESPLAPGPVSRPGPRGLRFQDLTVLGTLDKTYILAQGPDGLILIDQHAAHERVLYEALKARGPAAAAQTLLFPRVVEVNPAQADWVKDHLDQLAQAGLTLEPFGGASFMITAAPAALAHADLEAVVAEAVEALAPSKSFTQPQAVREQALQVMACRGAVKAGEALAPEAIRPCWSSWTRLPSPPTAPTAGPCGAS